MMPTAPPRPSPGSHGPDATPNRPEAGPGAAGLPPKGRRHAFSGESSCCYQWGPNHPGVRPLSPPLSVDDDTQPCGSFRAGSAPIPGSSIGIQTPLSPTRSVKALPTKTWYFWSFPPEIRNMIYDISLRWPTCQELYAPYNKKLDEYYLHRDLGEEVDFPVFDGKLWTPTILLLCRAITKECLPILQNRRFVIDRLPPWLPGALRPMLVSQFMGRRTLQNLRYIDIVVPFGNLCTGALESGWVWNTIALDIIATLREKNNFDELVIHMSIHNPKSEAHMESIEIRERKRLQTALMDLVKYNPRWQRPGIVDRYVWKVQAFNAVAQIVERQGNFRYVWKDNPDVTRTYPDPLIWPSCILQFARPAISRTEDEDDD